ncbi:thiol peroxidase [Mycoplasmopsis anatis]|uniref:Thiol peroxidase n=1 Tax=Mycoplasmopsis anatis TaxID=171279 RepID=A0A9Q3LAE4_9BACT|nr:redoxin domain-containing protein [Mycoplasmopsis anatis]MBW0594638.1 thiol peroxidase [Mycoplasmopsis anatis]MBW0595391.1 thiol peroxidase [Mycoplasmopsis anatis]MBW0596070.1 thiol peroxidase [Mycoplasmopsis anatis]MBW0596937.1 thiol peroxidase [Mycoplasmopsis anatis]MBW0597508.1 thiol peroxidase [Mycoplasmopsis anatis]
MKKIFFKNLEVTLSGEQLKLGDVLNKINDIFPAGSFSGENIEFNKGKYKILTTYPSVDTSVCDFQVLELSKITSEFPELDYIGISVDLPSALNSYKSMHPTGSIKMYSDYRTKNFSKQSGLLIDELQLLGRSIYVLDKENKVIYSEIKDQVGEQIDFDKLRIFLKNL